MKWLLLILSLPTQNTAARMRCWRALKGCGAAVLRDGVYLLPQSAEHEATLQATADDLRQSDGTAYLLTTEAPVEAFSALFDRQAEFGTLLLEAAAGRRELAADPQAALKQARRLRKSFEQLAAIDFFPGEAQRQAQEALEVLEALVHRALAPDEPAPAPPQALRRLDPAEYQGRTWATRERPWVDRLACAWLIRRFIDPQARFLWLKTPADCPPHALGFDFDGATFTHVGARVSFETLLACFGLETPPLLRVGLLVHSLDAGGVLPPEAPGVERVLAGMREALTDDDQLLLTAAGVFEGLYIAFNNPNP